MTDIIGKLQDLRRDALAAFPGIKDNGREPFIRLIDILITYVEENQVEISCDVPEPDSDEIAEAVEKLAEDPGLDAPAYAREVDPESTRDADDEVERFARVFDDVAKELGRAKAKFELWPFDPIHAMEVIHEEIGEMGKDTLQAVYEKEKGATPDSIRVEAIQSMAMLLRFVMALDNDFYEWNIRRQGQD